MLQHKICINDTIKLYDIKNFNFIANIKASIVLQLMCLNIDIK